MGVPEAIAVQCHDGGAGIPVPMVSPARVLPVSRNLLEEAADKVLVENRLEDAANKVHVENVDDENPQARTPPRT